MLDIDISDILHKNIDIQYHMTIIIFQFITLFLFIALEMSSLLGSRVMNTTKEIKTRRLRQEDQNMKIEEIGEDFNNKIEKVKTRI